MNEFALVLNNPDLSRKIADRIREKIDVVFPLCTLGGAFHNIGKALNHRTILIFK